MDEIKRDNALIAEFMGWPKVEVGSVWNYSRALDNSQTTKNLKVIEVNERGVKFDQRMAFEYYGLDFFDGDVFYPSDWSQLYNMNEYHCPARPYDKSWEWTMKVVKKAMRICEIKDYMEEKLISPLLNVDLKTVHEILVGEIERYNEKIKES